MPGLHAGHKSCEASDGHRSQEGVMLSCGRSRAKAEEQKRGNNEKRGITLPSLPSVPRHGLSHAICPTGRRTLT